MKKVYTFVYGVDGFGADTAPAYEEGVYLDYKKALEKQKKLNAGIMKGCPGRKFYEEGWGEDFCPNEYEELTDKLVEDENWDALEELYAEHTLTDMESICLRINEYDVPPYGFYQIVECNLY